VTGVLGAFLRRDARIAWSYRLPFVLEALSALFILVSVLYLGRLVPDGTVPGSYFSFAAAGLALTAFLQAGLSVVSTTFRQEQVQGTLEALLSTGVRPGALAAGMAGYPVLFAVVRVLVYISLAGLLGARAPGGNWGLATGAAAIGAIGFAGLGLVAAALVLSLRQAAGAVAFLVSVMGLAGGAFFPAELLPGWAQDLAQLSPFTHALALARGALLEGTSWAASLGRLGVLVALCAGYVAVGLLALRVAIARARRRGGISEY
jgi:ABC-2 type transport system permease protein